MFNFKVLHPATAQWFAQRDQCRRCKHARSPRVETQVMRCRMTHAIDAKRSDAMAYCIDARLEEQPCGPDARLFEPKDTM